MSLKGISFYALIISILSILITNEKIYYLYLLVFFIMFLIIKKYNFKVALILLIIPMFFSCYKLNSVRLVINRVRWDLIASNKTITPKDVEEILKTRDNKNVNSQ